MTNVENIFSFLDTYADEQEGIYLEGLIDGCNDWLQGVRKPSLNGQALSKEEVRRGLQLAILKGMKKQAQTNHQMTPDSIGMLLGHIANQLMKDKKQLTILDPTVGTGNLLYTVMNRLENDVQAFAVEIDDLLVRLAAVGAELLEQRVTFLVQDALRPLFIDPVDLVVSDLPVGYYPDDENALNYQLMPTEGHAYAHHLFIEQSLNHTKPGGYALFVIPSSLFESEQAAQLHQFLKKEAYIRAVIQLPTELFQSKIHEKSLLILQKVSDTITGKTEVLLAQVPNMQNKQAMAHFLQDLDEWAAKQQ